jgi:hypothetical protein
VLDWCAGLITSGHSAVFLTNQGCEQLQWLNISIKSDACTYFASLDIRSCRCAQRTFRLPPELRSAKSKQAAFVHEAREMICE